MTAGGDPARTERHADPSQSLGELVARMSETLSRLMRQEVALAKAEARQEATSAARGLGMIVGGGVFALVALILVSLSIAQWLTDYVALGWSYLIVALVWVLVGAVLLAAGRRALNTVSPMPQRTAETVREIPQALRGNP